MIEDLSPLMKKHFHYLLEQKAIIFKDGSYYFNTKNDPMGEEPKTETEVIEYVVWNRAARFYINKSAELC